jgi:antitoxin MazE
MKTQIQKWGNSLAVRIPKAFAAHLGMVQDSSVELALEDGNLVIRPSPSPKYQLSELLDRVTENNLHSEEDYGRAVGNEEW